MKPFSRTKKKFSGTRLRLMSRPVIALPLAVFAVFVIVSIAASSITQGALDTTRDRVIERRVQENALKLSNSITSYTLIASGASGFAETADVTADTWSDFVSAYNISGNFPSINAVTYAQVSGQNILVKYVEPNTPAFASRLGTDEYAIASRHSTIDTAIATNRPALTSEPQYIKPQNDPNAPTQLGFIIFAPIYDKSLPLDTADERRTALRGTANVSFQTSKFFDSIYADTEKQSQTYLTVYQGPNEQSPKVYEGGVHPGNGDTVDYVQHIPYANQTFTYHYQFSDSDLLTTTERSRPFATLLTGIALGGLLSIIMLFFIRARLHRLSFDKEREVQGAKDELLSLASHQLRTPATGVKQYMGMVLQGFAGDITPQQKEFLQKAYESNDRQLHIINDILHLAKLDAGRIVLTKTTFDMTELVQSVLDEQSDSAASAEVTLEQKLPKRMEVYADSHMMRMVVENLISNAIKYTHPGGTIVVSLKTGKGNYELSVKDTGVGIADSDRDKLFKQFSRVDNERSHLVSGTGVGLYLVKNLVELHSGNVSLSSKLGKGTTFTVSFPRENHS